MSFAGLIPDWRCDIGGQGGDTGLLNVCEINATKCSSFAFIGQQRTVISEWNLICDDKWAKQIITSVQMGGVLIGCMMIGQMGDSIGRKKSLYIFNFYHIVVNVIAAFSVSWIMFAALRFFIGIGIGGILVINFTYPMEFVPVRWRTVIASLPFWTIGVSFFALGSYILEDWVYLHFACAVLCLPSMLGVFYVPESIRWLTLQGRIGEAEKVFERIAAVNNKALPTDVRKVLEQVRETEIESRETSKNYTYLDMFKTWDMAKHSLIVVFWWSNLSMAFYGISFGVSSLSGSVYLNMFLMAALEYPFRIATAPLNNVMGRKVTSIGFFTLATLSSLGCLLSRLMAPAVYRDVYINWFSLAAMAMTGAAWASVQTWSSEMYPTVMRTLGYGLANTGARIGGIAAPFLLNFDDIPLVSYSVMVAVFAVCTLLCLVPPETKDLALTDSLVTKEDRGGAPSGKLPNIAKA